MGKWGGRDVHTIMYIPIRPRHALLYLGPLPLVAEADEGPSGRVIIVSPFLARN